jgi:hypothetical protein
MWDEVSRLELIQCAENNCEGAEVRGFYVNVFGEKTENGDMWVYSPSEVARSLKRSLPPECVEKGLNGAGECVVSEMELAMCELGV